MKLLNILILMLMSVLGFSQDSLTLHIKDASLLYEYANKGYYLKKVDSVNNFLILSLEKELDGVYSQKQKLELVVEKDNVLIRELFGAFRDCEYSNNKKDNEIKRLSVDNKRLKTEKREAIVTVVLLAVLGILLKSG